jgi:general stress protein 26
MFSESEAMNKRKLLEFLRSYRLGVQSSVSPSGAAQSAVVGFAIRDNFQIFFDTVDTSRKVENLRKNPRIAFAIGGLLDGDERTVQYEGIADEPSGAELESLKKVYFQAFRDGPARQSWPGICYIRVRPSWIRFSDYNQNPPEIVEFSPEQLASGRE